MWALQTHEIIQAFTMEVFTSFFESSRLGVCKHSYHLCMSYMYSAHTAPAFHFKRKNNFPFLYRTLCLCVCMCLYTCLWRIEDNLGWQSTGAVYLSGFLWQGLLLASRLGWLANEPREPSCPCLLNPGLGLQARATITGLLVTFLLLW